MLNLNGKKQSVALPVSFPVTLQRSGIKYSVLEQGSSFIASFSGSTIYISPTGDDATGDGSSGNPYKTIDKAVSIAVNNDIISMAAGDYDTPSNPVNKNVAFVAPKGMAYIGSFNDLSTATVTDRGGNVWNVADIGGKTWAGFLRTDGKLVAGVRGSAYAATDPDCFDYQQKGIMSVFKGSTSANFSTGTSETLPELIAAGKIKAWNDVDTQAFVIPTGQTVFIGENIIIASFAVETIDIQGSATVYLSGCEAYGGADSTISHDGTGTILSFNTKVAGAVNDNIDYRSTVTAVEVNITSHWCGRIDSANCSTGHDNMNVLRVGGSYRGGNRVIHDITGVDAFVFSCIIGDGLYGSKTSLVSGSSSASGETCTLRYGDIQFIDTFSQGDLIDFNIDTDATATQIEPYDVWPY